MNIISKKNDLAKKEEEWKAEEVEYKKETDWAFLKNHYPDPEQLTSQWQLAEENFALLIGLSKYTVL